MVNLSTQPNDWRIPGDCVGLGAPCRTFQPNVCPTLQAYSWHNRSIMPVKNRFLAELLPVLLCAVVLDVPKGALANATLYVDPSGFETAVHNTTSVDFGSLVIPPETFAYLGSNATVGGV